MIAISTIGMSTMCHISIWRSIFDISVANLVLIAVMVVIFGAARLLPFPRGVRQEPTALDGTGVGGTGVDGTGDGGLAAAVEPAHDGTASLARAGQR